MPADGKKGRPSRSEYYVDEKHYLNDERFLARKFLVHGRSPQPHSETRRLLRLRVRPRRQRHRPAQQGRRGEGVPQRLPPSRLAPAASTGSTRSARPRRCRTANRPTRSCRWCNWGRAATRRCSVASYHAWTYDLDGKLVAFPTGMPDNFDAAEHGLHPVPCANVAGLHLAESRAQRTRPSSSRGSATGRPSPTRLRDGRPEDRARVSRRQPRPTGSWCSRTSASAITAIRRTRSPIRYVHQNLRRSERLDAEQRARIDAELAKHGIGKRLERRPDQDSNAGNTATGPAAIRPLRVRSRTPAWAERRQGSHLKLGFVTGSMDGKALAPLLPIEEEWSRLLPGCLVGFSTSWINSLRRPCRGRAVHAARGRSHGRRALLAGPPGRERGQGLRREENPGALG